MKQSYEYRKLARELTKGKILKLFIVSLVFGAILSVLSFVAPLVSGYVVFGMTLTFIAIINGKDPKVDEVILAGVKEQPIKAFLLGLIQSIFISLWTLLFFIPGIIKSYSYALSTYILIKEPTIETMDAITKSRQLMDGKKGQLFALDFSYIGWYFLSLFTFGILTIWVSAWHQTARTLFMRDAYQPDAK
jgi:uncharacterized membrane protein